MTACHGVLITKIRRKDQPTNFPGIARYRKFSKLTPRNGVLVRNFCESVVYRKEASLLIAVVAVKFRMDTLGGGDRNN
jgi:hypothetical protein